MEYNMKMQETFDEYLIDIFKVIELLPRTAKFNLGEKIKESLYEIKTNLIKLSVEDEKRLLLVNLIDANVNTNRLFLRYLVSFGYMKKVKLLILMEKLNTFAYFVGRYLAYAKNDKK